jgi:predicted peptidase
LFPQAEARKRWLDADMEELVIAELDRTMTEFAVDPARVYLTGLSMGATGAYRVAYRWPNRFAAIVAIAGRVETSDAKTYSDRDKDADRKSNPFVSARDPFAALAEKIEHVPIRIFHGDSDETVPVEQSRRLVPVLKAARGCDAHDDAGQE